MARLCSRRTAISTRVSVSCFASTFVNQLLILLLPLPNTGVFCSGRWTCVMPLPQRLAGLAF